MTFVGTSSGVARAQYQVVNAFPRLTFDEPVDLQNAGDASGRLFVVERHGVIQVVGDWGGAPAKRVFLDITDRVMSAGIEEGLLGLAFDPDFKSNGFFYVDYVGRGRLRTVISRFRVSASNPDSADKASELVILEIPQPYSNHKGGQIAFGPDRYLWIALGDGGSERDPDNRGQDLTGLLAKILRIDVTSAERSRPYSIPPDNPFVGNKHGWREETYAYGLRNPWRFSFDRPSGRVWAADVGQDRFEEIDIIEKGKNYGWSIMEGMRCYRPDPCDKTGLTLPIWEYAHDAKGGNSITGGYVYRGPELRDLYGKYIYGDFVSGRIWALAYDGTHPPVNTELLRTDLGISSFGTDQNGEIYICDLNGLIYRLTARKNGG